MITYAAGTWGISGSGFPALFWAAALAIAKALLRKRAHEVARSWPLLVAGLGPDWPAAFTAWAGGRPPAGGLRAGRRPPAGPGPGAHPG